MSVIKVNVTWVAGAVASPPKGENAITQYEANQNDTIGALKQQIFHKKGLDIDGQRLIFSGKQLVDEDTLEQCKIVDGVTLHLLVKAVSPEKKKQREKEKEKAEQLPTPQAEEKKEELATPQAEEKKEETSAASKKKEETKPEVAASSQNEMKSVDEGAAIYIVCVASTKAMHMDDNGDKVCSTRYGDIRDQFSQWTLVPVDGADSTYLIVNVAGAAAMHCDGTGDNLCSSRFGDIRDEYSQWKFEAVPEIENAFYIENVMTKFPLHVDGNGDGLCSTRYGDCRDGYAQWSFEEA